MENISVFEIKVGKIVHFKKIVTHKWWYFKFIRIKALQHQKEIPYVEQHFWKFREKG